MIYNSDGKTVNNHGINYEYRRDSVTGAFYTIVNIPQVDSDGNKQYPFVLWDNYPNGGNKSVIQMNKSRNFRVAINAGRFSSPYGGTTEVTGMPQGMVIQNGENKTGTVTGSSADRVLTINNQGELGYANVTDSPSALIANGIVSAVSGFVPIIANYKNIQETDSSITYATNDADAQRQILGQYNNGDYIVISTEGRDNQGGGFFTVPQLQDLCKSLGVKFAFLLDGGGSTQTVIGQKQLNQPYSDELPEGRHVPTFIVFNGTTEFSLKG